MPWACYAIITVWWVIFHFIKLLHSKHLSSFLQNFSTHSFRCGKQYAVQKTITRSLHTNCTLESTLSRIFLFSFDFFFFFTIMFSSSKLQYSKLYFPFIYEGTEICINSKSCEKCGNTDLRARAKLYRPNLTAVNHSILRVWERVPIFAHLPRRNCERGLVSEYLIKGIVTFDFVLGHKSLEISLKLSQPRFLTAKQKSKLMTVDIWKSYMWTAD